MAYSCVRVSFEIGHEASIRTKRTPEGFTHDWEVFVRGADNTEINHFVEKVVFHLHETFPKPKRVIKEPPYSVKESGYAGFVLPIDVYFKNHDEPKKVRFNYDLHLQTSGPPISKVLREKYVFPNPAEDLRRRLIKGGGVGVVGNDASLHLASTEKPSITAPPGEDASVHKHSVPALVGKPKLGGDTTKKHKVKEYKPEEPRVSNSFADLFGPPIKTAKVSPDPKKPSHSPKVSPVPKSSKPADKSSSEKQQASASKPVKHVPQKEVKDSAERSTKEEKKEKSKERDKNKEKPPKRPSTPPKHPSTPPKHPQSPPKRSSTSPKRPPTPSKQPPTPPKHFPTPTKCPSTSPKQPTTPKSSSKDESKKSTTDEAKGKSESKAGDSGKSEKKKKDKKNRDEKPKKDKHKEHENKVTDKPVKNEKSSKDSKEKDAAKKIEKDPVKEPDKSREKEKEKVRHGDGDKEKQRHKHKKKDKSSKEKDKDKDREKSVKKSLESKSSEIKDKEKNGLGIDSSRSSGDSSNDIKREAARSPSPTLMPPVVLPVKPLPTADKPSKEKPAKHPLDVLLAKVSDNESSDSNFSPLSDEELLEPPPPDKMKPSKSSAEISEAKSTTIAEATSVLGSRTKANNKTETAKSKSAETSSQERNSLSKSNSKQQKEKSSSKKGKEKEIASGDVDKDITKADKDVIRKRKRKVSGKDEEGESCRNNGETAPKLAKLEPEPEEQDVVMEVDNGVVEPEVEPAAPTAQQLTEEYVTQLKELQHKIMTLEDNAELQRVVQVIAETGQYEITKKTFDFDLCALDRSTVQRLQDFFAPS